jgi:drug/metabolite transporter (DMT)-like permease
LSPSPLVVHLALLTVSLLFGINYVFSKEILDALSGPEWVRSWVWFRVVFATAILVPLSLRLARSWPRARLLPGLLLASFLGVVLNQVLFTEGLARTSPEHSAVINAGIPTWTMVIATLCGQERLSRRRVAALALALIGVGCLLRVDEIVRSGEGLSAQVLLGDLLTLANGISFALHLVLMRRIGRQFDPWASVAMMFLFATLLMSAWSGPSLQASHWTTLATPPVLWFAAFAVLGATVTTYLLNTWALRHTRSSQVALYINLQPVVAAALATAMGKPVPGWRFFVALVLVSFALFLQTRRD